MCTQFLSGEAYRCEPSTLYFLRIFSDFYQPLRLAWRSPSRTFLMTSAAPRVIFLRPTYRVSNPLAHGPWHLGLIFLRLPFHSIPPRKQSLLHRVIGRRRARPVILSEEPLTIASAGRGIRRSIEKICANLISVTKSCAPFFASRCALIGPGLVPARVTPIALVVWSNVP